MRITEPAATVILQTMSKEGLDIDKFAVSLEFVNGSIGFSFRDDKFGKEYNFHGLRVLVEERINTDDMVIDLSEVQGKIGLIFTEEKE